MFVNEGDFFFLLLFLFLGKTWRVSHSLQAKSSLAPFQMRKWEGMFNFSVSEPPESLTHSVLEIVGI